MKRENILIILSFVVLAFFLARMFKSGDIASGPQRSQELIYSDFKALVAAGDVVNAQIVGDSLIEGFTQGGLGYRTYIPAEDPSVIDFLRLYQIPINYVPEKSLPWYLSILINWGPFILIFGIWMVLMRRMQSGGTGGGLFSIGRSRAKKMEPDEMKVTFDDVAGIEEAKNDLRETVEFLKDPAKFRKLGGRIPKGMLMSGSPGTGKTLLAKAVAGEAEVPFFSMSGSDFVEMFVGVGAARVRDLFMQGKRHAPCLIFIDEIDAVGRQRGAGLGGGHDEREQTLNQLLVEMDGFETNEGVILIAATNRPDVLDPALLRPGRFDRQVVVPNPDVRGRLEILKIYAKKVAMSEDVDLEVLARGTPGFSGADLENMVNEAALIAAKKDKDKVEMEDLEEAKDKVLMGKERKSAILSEEEKKVTAYHEAGHAIVAKVLPKADPVHKVSIVPRGQALGITMQLPLDDRHNYTKGYLEDTLAVLMGGRVSEELFFNEMTTGAANDLDRATKMARRMVCEWGMSETFGSIALEDNGQEVFLGRELIQHKHYSEETARLIDREVMKIVKQAYDRAREILEANEDKIHRVVEYLLERETLTGEELSLILEGKELPSIKKEVSVKIENKKNDDMLDEEEFFSLEEEDND